MSVTLVEMTKNTRGKDSREIKYMGIGRPVTRVVEKESDEAGNPLGKDAEGKLITRKVEVTELSSDGVVTSIDDALELVGGDTQKFLDMFAFGFNRAAYQTEADKDELDIFCEGLDEAQAKARKTAIRALAKTLPNFTLMECGEIIRDASTTK